MRFKPIYLLVLAGLSILEACKTVSRTSSSRAKAKAVTIPQGSGNGMNLAGTGFVWEKTELPLCFSARNGMKFYVWKEQSTFACDKGQKGWQLVAQNQPTTKKKG
jgi:hypothetical protein